MGLPRSKYVKDGQEGVFHCFSRCVRRAFLCGFDPITQRDYSHRKTLLVDRLRQLAAIFAIEVCAYAIMENHDHTVLRTRPDIVATWSDREVATRWLTLFPIYSRKKDTVQAPTDDQISTLADNAERIVELRKRLSSLSWFMGRLNEFIARAANKEDKVKGRFWESRFKCQALLDDAAIVACMVYVDLNPIRAGVATTPEESNFTSIQERIREWQKETRTAELISAEAAPDVHAESLGLGQPIPENTGDISQSIPERLSVPSHSLDVADGSVHWLCPISSVAGRRGILQLTLTEYLNLVDQSGRMIRSDKQGAIDSNLKPILLRIGANPDAWIETVSHFGGKFRLAAGLLCSLRTFANHLGRRWLKGVAAARTAFASAPPQLA